MAENTQSYSAQAGRNLNPPPPSPALSLFLSPARTWSGGGGGDAARKATLVERHTANKETDNIIKKELMVIFFSLFPWVLSQTKQRMIFFFRLVDAQTFFFLFQLDLSWVEWDQYQNRKNSNQLCGRVEKENHKFCDSHSVAAKWTFS